MRGDELVTPRSAGSEEPRPRRGRSRHGLPFGRLSGWDVALAIVAGLLALFTLYEATEDVASDETAAFDLEISEAIVDVRSGWFTNVMEFVTGLGDTQVVLIVSIVAALFAAHRVGRACALGVALSPLTAIILVNTMKVAIGRDRPSPPIGLLEHQSASFPSGHAALSVAAWGALAWTLATGASNARKAATAAAAVLVTALIGFSRVYLGAHWATDVVAGWAAGSVCLTLGVVAAALDPGRARSSPTAFRAGAPVEASADEQNDRSGDGPRVWM